MIAMPSRLVRRGKRYVMHDDWIAQPRVQLIQQFQHFSTTGFVPPFSSISSRRKQLTDAFSRAIITVRCSFGLCHEVCQQYLRCCLTS